MNFIESLRTAFDKVAPLTPLGKAVRAVKECPSLDTSARREYLKLMRNAPDALLLRAVTNTAQNGTLPPFNDVDNFCSGMPHFDSTNSLAHYIAVHAEVKALDLHRDPPTLTAINLLSEANHIETETAEGRSGLVVLLKVEHDYPETIIIREGRRWIPSFNVSRLVRKYPDDIVTVLNVVKDHGILVSEEIVDQAVANKSGTLGGGFL